MNMSNIKTHYYLYYTILRGNSSGNQIYFYNLNVILSKGASVISELKLSAWQILSWHSLKLEGLKGNLLRKWQIIASTKAKKNRIVWFIPKITVLSSGRMSPSKEAVLLIVMSTPPLHSLISWHNVLIFRGRAPTYSIRRISVSPGSL